MSEENVPPDAAHQPAPLTRRVLLVAGGLTLLAGCSPYPVERIANAAPTQAVQTYAASHPVLDLSDPAGPARTPPSNTGSARHRMAAKDAHRRGSASREAGRCGDRHAAGDRPTFYVDDGPKGIALTIDDGPNPVYTPQVLRLLEKYRVTATFSMIGIEVESYPGVARDVAAAGHIIANHTWTHPDLALLGPAAIDDQLNRATGAIHKVTGRVPTLFRAPYGAWSPAVLRRCAQTGMTPLDWSVDPRDWSRPGVSSIVGNIMANTRTGSIILEHDGGGNRSQTVAALKIVLPRLLAAGYHFHTP
jgi:peptidoglycan/xylan/chitin deacetylase (PgdA/CDA1 family)